MIKPTEKLPPQLPRYTLPELLSQELEQEPEIDWGNPQGNEEW